MPVRFRCVYCNKLLSIATRKAGTVINCPTCEKPLIVPTPEPENEAQEEPAPQSTARTVASGPTAEQGKGGFFERDDFDQILNQGINNIQTQAKAPRQAPSVEPMPDVRTRPGTEIPIKLPEPPPPQVWLPPEPAQPAVVSDVELVSLTSIQVPQQKGIVLSPIKMILLFLFLIGVLSVVFVIGFYVGRATAPHQIIMSSGTGG